MLQCVLQYVAARIAIRGGEVFTRDNGAHSTMKRKSPSPDAAQAAIAEFLNAHYAHAHVNDVGPVLGRLAALSEGPSAEAVAAAQWNAAVSAALTAH
jgi:hypothetical protein